MYEQSETLKRSVPFYEPRAVRSTGPQYNVKNKPRCPNPGPTGALARPLSPPLHDSPFYNFKALTARPAKVVVSPRRNAKTGTEKYGRVRKCFLPLKSIIVVSPGRNTRNEGPEEYGKSTEEYGKVRKPIVSLRRNAKTGTDKYGGARKFSATKKAYCCFA